MRDLLQQALDALLMAQVDVQGALYSGVKASRIAGAIDAIRAHLAQPPSDPACPSCAAPGLLHECVHCGHSNYPAPAQDVEPVAWMGDGTFISDAVKRTALATFAHRYPTPLYLHPASQEQTT